MSYLSFVLAALWLLIRGEAEGIPFRYEGLDMYLDLVVGIERFFFLASLVVFTITLAIVLILAIVSKTRGGVFLIPCGCQVLLITGVWFLLEGWTLLLATRLADSVTAVGIVNETRFWLLVILMVLFGLG